MRSSLTYIISFIAIALLLIITLGNTLYRNRAGQRALGSDGDITDKGESAMDKDKNYDTAIFAAGCFWGVEAAFRTIEGVVKTEVGYTGGHTEEPTYRQVCTGKTGHGEAVQVRYDPEVASYEKLLQAFWQIHDPTQVNRQGPDVGSQYRSAIFYLDDRQKAAAEESHRELTDSGRYKRSIATEISEAGQFWRAEEYHQQYFEKTGRGNCHVNLSF